MNSANMNLKSCLLIGCLFVAAASVCLLPACSDLATDMTATTPAAGSDPWRSTFDVDKRDLVSTGTNPYFPLKPGQKVTLAADNEEVIISVLADTKVVDGVECRVVEERESKGGKLVEVSRNYYAIDKNTNDLYYFGEDVDDYKDGKVTGHGGTWLSGEKGAKFGLMLPGKPAFGDKYYQEQAPGAMDRAEVMDTRATLATPLKSFTDVLHIRETSPLEAGASPKWYAPGVGMIGDDELRITKVEGGTR
jgi:hypothetical protein